jgi:hypothetical protein
MNAVDDTARTWLRRERLCGRSSFRRKTRDGRTGPVALAEHTVPRELQNDHYLAHLIERVGWQSRRREPHRGGERLRVAIGSRETAFQDTDRRR